ncbi:hypothetical protein LTR56_025120 [Elasticomyces elasticus]|nr:hypothetical protein LTR56_025120 [Elasticomyces elasticus]KAK3635849.1 hypothetical protein LTR22_018984 [Elasticomyces elasticus]KAK4919805.1 hypothetical protein LTR49_012552 [Elasticomyces elasticus]KAK5741142.1 hypothetical protein LTS12_024696 [Elasticomyces elasticus]
MSMDVLVGRPAPPVWQTKSSRQDFTGYEHHHIKQLKRRWHDDKTIIGISRSRQPKLLLTTTHNIKATMDYEQFIEMTHLHAEVVGVIQTSRDVWQHDYEVKAAECERLQNFYNLIKQANEDKTKEIKALKAENERLVDQLDDEKDVVDQKIHEMEAMKAQHKQWVSGFVDESTEDYERIMKLDDQVRSLEWDKKDLSACVENLKKGAKGVLIEKVAHERKCAVLVEQYRSLEKEKVDLAWRAEDANAELEKEKKIGEGIHRIMEGKRQKLEGEKKKLEGENKKLDEALQVAKVELLPVKEDLRVSRRDAQHNLIATMKLRKEFDAAQGLNADLQTELDRVNAGWQTDREKLFEYHTERATVNRLLWLAENKVKVGEAFEEMMRKDLRAQRKITANLELKLCDSVERREIEKKGMMEWGKKLQSDFQNDMRVARYIAEEEKSKAAKSAVTRELVLKAAHRWELKNAFDNAQFWYEKCQREMKKKEEAQLAAQGWVEVEEKDEDDEVVGVDDASQVTDDEADLDTDEECQMASHDEDEMMQACVDSRMELDEGEMVEAVEQGDLPDDEGEMVEATAAVEDEANEMVDDEMTEDEGEMVEAEEWEAEESDGELIEMDDFEEYCS